VWTGSAAGGFAHLGERRAPPGVVDDVGHHTLDVPMALGEVLRGGGGGESAGDGVSSRHSAKFSSRKLSPVPRLHLSVPASQLAIRRVPPPPRHPPARSTPKLEAFTTHAAAQPPTPRSPVPHSCGPRSSGSTVSLRKRVCGLTDCLCLAAPFRLEVFEVKMDPAPLR
jgi:hypothetical protein